MCRTHTSLYVPALLKIKSTSGACAVKTPSVRTVCLPPLHTQLPPGFTCSIAGFGKERSGKTTFLDSCLPHPSQLFLPDSMLSADSSKYSQLLKQADVSLLSETECKRESTYTDLVTENMICAASPDWSTDACEVSKLSIFSCSERYIKTKANVFIITFCL